METFTDRVKNVVRDIPAGTVMSYKDVAYLAGSPRAYRAVGMIMKNNTDPEIPCHRVVRSDGAVGGYNGGGPQKKLEKLRKEGAYKT